jgi:hypothetical protein
MPYRRHLDLGGAADVSLWKLEAVEKRESRMVMKRDEPHGLETGVEPRRRLLTPTGSNPDGLVVDMVSLTLNERA